MSLSTQYLDELSRRYKRQIEELSRSLATTLAESKRGEAREAKLQAELSVLATQLASLTVAVESVLSQSESWLYKVRNGSDYGRFYLSLSIRKFNNPFNHWWPRIADLRVTS